MSVIDHAVEQDWRVLDVPDVPDWRIKPLQELSRLFRREESGEVRKGLMQESGTSGTSGTSAPNGIPVTLMGGIDAARDATGGRQ